MICVTCLTASTLAGSVRAKQRSSTHENESKKAGMNQTASSRINRGAMFIAINSCNSRSISSKIDVQSRTASTYLEEQFTRVRNRQLGNILGTLTQRAIAVVSHESARLTDIDNKVIGRDHETLEKELCSSVSDETISFHFS